ncbi:MAG: hypothetical protein HXY34_11310 [Candidatus Thorarchaeota archaeon]|nr:hypothetical protein [Candidatus Thorarchaeota archaeon]
MKDDIRAVKDSLFDIVDRVTERTRGLVIRFGIVSYRDHPPQDKTYVTKIFDFSDDIKKVHREISKLDPSEGGDMPEAVADALHDARTSLSWMRDSYKVLILVGDAPPHGRAYNNMGDDAWPNGCPCGYDPKNEVQLLKKEHGSTVFVFVCGCNPVVEDAFRSIANAVDGGVYYSLVEVRHVPDAILKILEGMSDLIESDQKVLRYYQSHDGVFDLGQAASDLGLELREVKTSLSRLIELGTVPRWPKGRPLSSGQIGLSVELGDVPDAILPGKAFKYQVRVKNPSSATAGVRIVVSIVSEDGVSEITNEQHEIAPRGDSTIDLKLVPIVYSKGKASVKVEVYYGSKPLASRIYSTRVY